MNKEAPSRQLQKDFVKIHDVGSSDQQSLDESVNDSVLKPTISSNLNKITDRDNQLSTRRLSPGSVSARKKEPASQSPNKATKTTAKPTDKSTQKKKERVASLHYNSNNTTLQKSDSIDSAPFKNTLGQPRD